MKTFLVLLVCVVMGVIAGVLTASSPIGKPNIKGEWVFADDDKEKLIITVTDEFVSVPIPITPDGLKFKYEAKYQGKWVLITLLPDKAQEGLLGKEKMSLLFEADGSDKLKAICIGPNPNQIITRKNGSVENKE